jgi:peptidoglycan hydrolase-like protein with peptidoglycan-binding domain
MLGPRTREAVIAFQKQRGFKANGEIDHDTFAALSGNEGARGEQSSPNDQNGRGRSETTGQAPAGRNVGPSGAQGNNPQSSSQGGNTSHNASESPGGNRPSAGGPSTTGQSGGNLSGREENPSPAQGNRRRNENPH